MDIYIVQPGDIIDLIANKYGITVERLIADNGLINPNSLVVGQALIILYPQIAYLVQEGDTLTSIADNNGISNMQLIRNNPFLFDREFIYPGDTLVIKYNTIKNIQVNGYTNAFINKDVLRKSLPYLTYISIFNYQITDQSGIISYDDDTGIIKTAKQYDTIPLMMISALSPTGEADIEYIYRLLLDSELQDSLISDIIQIVKSKEYLGVNFLISYITTYNQSLYLKVFQKISASLKNHGYIFMITISPDYIAQEDLDYNSISLYVDRIIFLQNIWVKKNQPPSPISNISLIKPFIENVLSKVSSSYVSLGMPLIGCDWVLPYVPGNTGLLMSLNSSIVLAYDQNAVIVLDQESQTPFFTYIRSTLGAAEKHIVWFIDANSINALNEVILENNLVGTGIWNITSYNQMLFSIINATYNIIKFPLQS